MSQELCWIFGFNIVVNSLLSFFTAFLLIKLFLFIFRVRHPRIRAICSLLPFVKICLDVFSYHFSNWALLQGINPLIAEIGTRQLSLMVNPWMGIGLNMLERQTFSLADVIALSVDPVWIRSMVCLVAAGTIVSCSLFFFRLLKSKREVRHLLKSASLIAFPSDINSKLLFFIKKRGMQLGITSALASPCLAGKIILFPASLWNDLSPEMRDAIIAHEMGHFTWRDGALRFLCAAVAAVFWWVPTQWVHSRIAAMQERACDSWIHRFGICKFALANAIVQTANRGRGKRSSLLCSFIERPSSLKRRVEWMMQERAAPSRAIMTIQYGLVGVTFLSILFGKMWIF
jgi:beta-lactamase regulating signal transducer with metallopeptidase domain